MHFRYNIFTREIENIGVVANLRVEIISFDVIIGAGDDILVIEEI